MEQQIETYQNSLERELSFLNDSLPDTNKDPFVLCGAPDLVDRAVVETNLQLQLAFVKSTEEKIKNIRKVLEMLDDGWDLRCEMCDTPIPMGRLMLVPCCLCVTCTEKEEKKNKHRS